MGYRQLSIEERCEVARLQAEGASCRQIARRLDRSPSTIWRELSRNSSKSNGYYPTFAHQRAWARRWTGSRLERDHALRERVLGLLAFGHSPEQAAQRLAREAGQPLISYETIYRFIYAEITRTKDYRWRRYLSKAKWRRGRRPRKGGSSASFILGRRPIAERPQEVDDRAFSGHWEADTMQFGRSGPVVLVVHERSSRLTIAARLASKEAVGVAASLAGLLALLPPALRRSVTFDNGTEFARHYELHGLGIETFFCDVYAPWQKGGVEHAIGRLRRFLPRKTDLASLPPKAFTLVLQAYNNTPRKCLGWRTPAEVFNQQVLHFKRECTFPPTRERRNWSALRVPSGRARKGRRPRLYCHAPMSRPISAMETTG